MTSISLILLLQFGQISIAGSTEHASVVLMTFPSPDKMSGRAKRLTLGLGACQSEKQELELARSLCDSGSITNIIVRPLFTRVEKKEASYGASRDADDARRCFTSCLHTMAMLATLAQKLHTIRRSFPKISSALSTKVCGGSKSANLPGRPRYSRR